MNWEQDKYDVLVIGGGITGAGIALDASMRGLKVCLLEKNDFASGTSSRSTKLIHGGLRYLKQMEFKLVHDVGTERRIVYENARHLVRPEKMILPIIQKGSLSKTLTAIALWTYDWLGGVHKEERKKMLNKQETIQTEPTLKKHDLLSGALYYEYRTDDARLCISVIKSALEEGAACKNYHQVNEFIYDAQGKAIGATVEDLLHNKTYKVYASSIVNATGPWVDELRNIDRSLHGKRLQLTKGVHLVVPYELLPIKQSVYFDTDDKRMIFCIPRQFITYIGTTDTMYVENKNNPICTKEDVNYLLRQVNNRFENIQITLKDVKSSWAGLRPLIYEEGKSASELSRKDEIFISTSGLLSIAGGKLTGYRLMAEHVVDNIQKQLNYKKTACNTRNKRLAGAGFESEDALLLFIETKKGECKQLQIPQTIIENWVYRYGTYTNAIVEIAFDRYQLGLKPDMLAYTSELIYTIHNEHVHTISDFLIRRNGMLYFESEKLNLELINELQKVIEKHVELNTETHQKNYQQFVKALSEARLEGL